MSPKELVGVQVEKLLWAGRTQCQEPWTSAPEPSLPPHFLPFHEMGGGELEHFSDILVLRHFWNLLIEWHLCDLLDV